MDALQGITRVDTSLLFDVRSVAAGNQTAASDTASAATTVSGTAQLSSIVLQSNEAYVMDKQGGTVYKCHISSKDCAAVLKTGDSAGGQESSIAARHDLTGWEPGRPRL